MPVVRRADTDGVDVLACQQFPEVLIVDTAISCIGLVDAVAKGSTPAHYRIADCHNTCILFGQKGFAVVAIDVACADQAQRDAIAWRDCSIAAECRGGDNMGKHHSARHANCRIPEKPTPCYSAERLIV